jgi:ATP-dependent helicase HrpB
MTDGTFLKRLEGDKDLKDVGFVVLDECHERGVNTDMALGLLLSLMSTKRNDLRLITMSATSDSEGLLALFAAHAPKRIQLEGQKLDNHVYWPITKLPTYENYVTSYVYMLLDNVSEQKWAGGDILVFVPGIREINQMQEAVVRVLESLPETKTRYVEVLRLYRDQAADEQQLALVPTSQDVIIGGESRTVRLRRIILSTNIGETSITSTASAT